MESNPILDHLINHLRQSGTKIQAENRHQRAHLLGPPPTKANLKQLKSLPTGAENTRTGSFDQGRIFIWII
jgi:hypothetical protein